jgi:hypothetical protein
MADRWALILFTDVIIIGAMNLLDDPGLIVDARVLGFCPGGETR